ncbi:hypothetical protein OVA03_07630 [Asticcacaulis sp. SL142]|uniref:hypothetical protein n=1 Tax=Asticcacaulis sp. SL142 TaxID=2995155 RepID=UPI00226CDE4A|nr:hypothetical protein [Asticcacaulis sp. SL142]WAC49759.1 hypothetical protein OVA03_07630 [Asticcacaulis sp. SL142]
MKARNLVLLIIAIFGFKLSSFASESDQSDLVSSAKLADCSTFQSVLSNLDIKTISGEDVSSDIEWKPDNNQTLILAHARRVTGKCAAQISYFRGDFIEVNEKIVLSIKSSPATEGNVRFNDLKIKNSDNAHPSYGRGSFIAASHVQWGRGDNYVGVWQEEAKWVVGAYSRSVNGAFSPVEHIFSSAFPIRSVSYYPSFDAPGGSLGVVQDRKDEVRLIRLDWMHGKLFD